MLVRPSPSLAVLCSPPLPACSAPPPCSCGYVFCSGHRHAQDHNCSFDYAAFDKTNLAKANQKVVAAKVDKL